MQEPTEKQLVLGNFIDTLGTVFTRIVTAATINFNLARVWLLFEGGYYSRAAFIFFSAREHGAKCHYIIAYISLCKPSIFTLLCTVINLSLKLTADGSNFSFSSWYMDFMFTDIHGPLT